MAFRSASRSIPTSSPKQPTIDAHQDRGDARANVPIGGFFKLFEFRGGISKYHHDELDPDGAVGSRFFSNGGELRADVVQSERGGWGGTSGVQYLNQDARIRGDEKYLPDSRKQQLGLFTLQTSVRASCGSRAAARVEFARLHADADDGSPIWSRRSGADIRSAPSRSPATSRRCRARSAAITSSLPGWRAGLSLSHSERAPSVDELFSFGPHGGSEQFLIGDPDLGIEKSNGVELSLHRTTGPVHVQGSVYYSRFSNFIFQAPTGEIQDGLPVYEYRAGQGRIITASSSRATSSSARRSASTGAAKSTPTPCARRSGLRQCAANPAVPRARRA